MQAKGFMALRQLTETAAVKRHKAMQPNGLTNVPQVRLRILWSYTKHTEVILNTRHIFDVELFCFV